MLIYEIHFVSAPATNSSNDYSSSVEQPDSDSSPAAVVKTTRVSVDCERCHGNRHGGSYTCSCADCHANPSKRESDSLLVPAPGTSGSVHCNAEDGLTLATAVNADVTPQPATLGVGGGQPCTGSSLTATAHNDNIGERVSGDGRCAEPNIPLLPVRRGDGISNDTPPVEHEEELSISDMDSTECKRLRLSQYRWPPQQQHMNANLTTPKVA